MTSAQLDPRDAQLIETIGAAVGGMILAIHRSSPEQLNVEIAKLVRAIIRHRDSLIERPGDQALRQAIARLG